MSLTRKYLDYLSSAFNAIVKLASPETKAAQNNDNAKLALNIDILECQGDISCKCKCCKTPVHYIRPFVVKPIYYSTALIFGCIGVAFLPCTIAVDGLARCNEDNSSAETKARNKKNDEELIQLSETERPSSPIKRKC